MIATVTLNPSLDEWIELGRLRLGTLNRADAFARYPGGKGINVSRVIRKLGGATLAYGFAGGQDGLILRQLMKQLRLPHRFLPVGESTRNNYKIRTESPRVVTEVNTPGPHVSRQALRRLQAQWLAPSGRPTAIAFCGSLPPGAPHTIYHRWIRRANQLGILTALDTSGSALRAGVSARPWLIKPNRQEAEELLRQRLTTHARLVRAAKALARLGPRIVILSLGKGGALLSQAAAREVWWAKPPVVRIDSSVGAGDSLVGGFLFGWTRRRRLLEAFRVGVACGTAAAMTRGTELCHRADVRRILPRVTMQRVA